MWDQKLVYDFSKGAWLTFRELGKRMETVKLELNAAQIIGGECDLFPFADGYFKIGG